MERLGVELDQTAPPAVVEAVSPFAGLNYYTESDAEWFFGRTDEAQTIVGNLRAARLTILYSQSGVGKSSVLRAGVTHELIELAHRRRAQGRRIGYVPVVFNNWKDDPVDELIRAIERASAPFACGALVVLPRDDLGSAIAEASEMVQARLLIILDQFEEQFLYTARKSTHGSFVEQLGRCVENQSMRANFLIAIREDAYPLLGDLFAGKIGNVYGNYLQLAHLDRDAARKAIIGPIKHFNQTHPREPEMSWDDALVEEVLDQVRTEKVALNQSSQAFLETGNGAPRERDPGEEIDAPYLQLVMATVWGYERERGSDALRLETLRTLGGAEVIMREHLDNALNALQRQDRDTAFDLFRYLVTPSGSKIAYAASDLAEMTERPEEEVVALLRTLAQSSSRIVRHVGAGSPETASVDRFEIFHDALAPAIIDWRRRVQEQRRTAEQERRRQKLEQEKKDAEELATKERQRARRFMGMVVALVVLLLFAVGAAIYAAHQTAKANRETRTARTQSARAAYFGLTTRAESQLASRPDIALLLFLGAYGESLKGGVPPGLRPLAERSLVATLQAVQRSGASGMLHGHTDAIETLAFSPRAQMLASGSGDTTIRLWRVSPSGHYPIGRPLKVGGPVFSLSFSPDGRSLASGSFNQVAVWSMATDMAERIPDPGGAVTSVAYSPRGDWLAAGSLNGTVLLWNTGTHTTVLLRASPAHAIRSVAFSPDGRVLASGGVKGSIVLWRVPNQRPLGRLQGRASDVYAVTFSPSGSLFAAAGAGPRIVLWNVANQQVQATLAARDPFIYSLAFEPRTNVLAVGGIGHVELWDTRNDRLLGAPLLGHQGSVYGVAFSADGRTLASGGADRTIRLWDLPVNRANGVPLSPGHTRGVISVATARPGVIASASDDGEIVIAHGRSGQIVTIHAPSELHAITFAESGRLLVSAGNDGVIRLWDAVTGKAVAALTGHRGPVFALAASPDGTELVSGGSDGTVRVWNVSAGREIGLVLRGGQGPVYAVAFNPSATEVASGGNDRTIRIWSLEGRSSHAPRVIDQSAAIFSLAFSPDGRELVSGGADDSIRLWLLGGPSGLSERTLTGDSDFVRGVAFSPDGKTLASASADHTVRLWDVDTGTELGEPLTGDTDSVESVAFSPDGSYLVSGSEDNTVRLWRAVALPSSFPAFRSDICEFLGAGLSSTEWSQFAPDIPFEPVCSRATPG